jgi:quercetin dioxygenase-like cupin family protein
MWRIAISCIGLAALLGNPAFADEPPAKPDLVLREVVEGMPTGVRQEIRVLTATLAPGMKTPFHTHRFPVTVHVLEGSFTLDIEDRGPVTISAGKSWVEPPGMKMIGHNSGAGPLKVVIFYVSDPDTPFLDPAQQ